MKFSVIIVAYSFRRINYLKKALSSLSNQTYQNIEIILVLNGSDDELYQFSKKWAKQDTRNKLLYFEKGYDLKNSNVDIGKYRYRKGIEVSSGDYIFCQSDDDFLSNDFFERMNIIFSENKDCITAIGLPVDYYWNDNSYSSPSSGLWQTRDKYTDGKELFLNWIKDRSLFINPGFCYVVKREILLKHIQKIWFGYDFSIFMTIVPTGITGFDKNAFMYWGRHQNQSNNKANINHYENFIYLKPSLIRDKYALKIWNTHTDKSKEIDYLKLFQEEQITFFSTHGFYYNLKKINLIKMFIHLKYIKNIKQFSNIFFLELKRDLIQLFKKIIHFSLLKVIDRK